MPERTLDNESRYTLLRRLQENPGASQRELAKELGISLGKTNYCLKALLDKGCIKAGNFKPLFLLLFLGQNMMSICIVTMA